jgi:ricin-type beta-trefoil lectin protein
MTDNHDDATERTEPVLVRPYVKTDDVGGETWPEKYDEQATPAATSAESDTLVQPAVVDEPPAPSDALAPSPARRPRLLPRLLALVVGVALAGGITYMLGHDDDTTTAQPGAILPTPDTVVPTGGAASAPGKASPSSSASVSPSASASISASAAVPRISGSASAPGVPPQASVPASTGPTLDPPPAADRSGTITAASGRCLMRGGLLGVDGSPVQVAGCGVASTFTLAADGTLRVSGRCAQVTGDSTVRIDDCDGQASAQWRQGPGDSLVNPASNQCLTDPGHSGATTKAVACTGGSEQSWTLS